MRRSITDKLGRHVSGWRIKDGGRGGGSESEGKGEGGEKRGETQSGGRKMRKGDGLPGC